MTMYAVRRDDGGAVIEIDEHDLERLERELAQSIALAAQPTIDSFHVLLLQLLGKTRRADRAGAGASEGR